MERTRLADGDAVQDTGGGYKTMYQPLFLPAMPQRPSYQVPYRAPNPGPEAMPYFPPYPGSFGGNRRAARGMQRPTTAPPLEIVSSSPPTLPGLADMSTGFSSQPTTMLLDMAVSTTEDLTTTAVTSGNLATTMQAEDWVEYDYYYDEETDSTAAPETPSTEPPMEASTPVPEAVSTEPPTTVSTEAPPKAVSTEEPKATKSFSPQVVTHIMTKVSAGYCA